MRSLRLRLFAFIAALAALTAIGVAAATYASVHAEADELFDYHLRQMALSLRDQGRIEADERSGLDNPDFDYVVQIWSIDGLSLYTSRPRPQQTPLPPTTVLGLSTVQLDGAPWRVFGVATPLRIVQVAQPLAVRQRLAAVAAARSVLPVLVAAPLVALTLWWLVGVSLAPLSRVADAARRRDAATFGALPTAGLPAEVEPLVAAFNGLLERLATSFESQRAFVADAAHELRSPLTALKLQIGLLADAPEGEARRVALERLKGGVDRATRLVEQLLALARAEPAAPPPMVAVDLAEVARQALADAAALARQVDAGIEVHADVACPVRGDFEALRSLVRNLIDNALRHGGRQPRLRVAVMQQDGSAVLQVDDQGPGIPEAERERMFDRFHRREGAASEGSGLGLAIVRAVAQQHGGSVRLLDPPGGGLRAELRLPLAPS